MRAIIITIGDEILLGQIVDTNSRFIADRLTKVGIEVTRMLSVSDEEYDIEERMMMSLFDCDIVVMTGGLGPTKDDVTKRMLSRLFRMELVEDPEVLANVERLIANGGMRMNPGNRSQALVPNGCRVLMNRKGTAPGMWFERRGKVIVVLPGVPFEMEDLMDREVVPALQERFPGLLLDYRVMKVYDIPESELSLRLEGFEERLPEGRLPPERRLSRPSRSRPSPSRPSRASGLGPRASRMSRRPPSRRLSPSRPERPSEGAAGRTMRLTEGGQFCGQFA